MDKDVERLIYHIAEIVEIRREALQDLENNRHLWSDSEIEDARSF